VQISNAYERTTVMPAITPNLWFDMQGQEAAEFYVSVFPNSEIKDVLYHGEAGPGPAGTVLTVDFVLDGKRFVAINGGPEFTFNEAISLSIDCADQAEVDYYWTKLTDGGEEGPCGWLKDRYGLSWQVVPAALVELLMDPDAARAQRAMGAMLQMRKIDVAALYAAADQA
jgi:predicted 3-demethylubiquinone-9 3-methyltransferase (glyoxalase superfamily)